jgi:hypothetical protein
VLESGTKNLDALAVVRIRRNVIDNIAACADGNSDGVISPDEMLRFCQLYLAAIDAPQHLRDHAGRMAAEVVRHCPSSASANLQTESVPVPVAELSAVLRVIFDGAAADLVRVAAAVGVSVPPACVVGDHYADTVSSLVDAMSPLAASVVRAVRGDADGAIALPRAIMVRFWRRRAAARGEAKALSETEAESQLREWCENNGCPMRDSTLDGSEHIRDNGSVDASALAPVIAREAYSDVFAAVRLAESYGVTVGDAARRIAELHRTCNLVAHAAARLRSDDNVVSYDEMWDVATAYELSIQGSRPIAVLRVPSLVTRLARLEPHPEHDLGVRVADFAAVLASFFSADAAGAQLLGRTLGALD